MLFDNYSTNAAEASLDALWLKTKVISNNLANVDTPGFKASSVNFEQVLRDQSAKLASRAPYYDPNQQQNMDNNQMQAGNSSNGDPQAAHANNANLGTRGAGAMYRTSVSQDNATSVRIDENNVSLEKEQTELWKAYAQYSYLLDRVSGHYNSINSAISNSRV